LSIVLWIAVQVNRRSFAATREIIRDSYPVLENLLPSEPYLKREDGSFIPQSSMKIWNSWLTTLNTSAPSMYPIFDAIKGTGFPNTPLYFTVTPPTWLDTSLGNWTDGKPIKTDVADGDDLIAGTREVFSDDPSFAVNQSHRNTIASTEGIKKILEKLEIPFTDDNIVPGAETKLTPGVVFFLLSPATFTVTYNNQVYTESDGILYIPDAKNGTYTITVTGTGTGTYSLNIGQFTETKTVWSEYTNTTKPGAQKTYQLSFDSTNPKTDPVTTISLKERLETIEKELDTLDTRHIHPFLLKARFDLRTAQRALDRKQYHIVKINLEQILFDLSLLRRMRWEEAMITKTFTIANVVIDAYQAILQQQNVGINTKTITRMTTLTNEMENRIGKDLEKQAKRNKNLKRNAMLFDKALSYKSRAEDTPSDELPRKYILLFQSQLLFSESR